MQDLSTNFTITLYCLIAKDQALNYLGIPFFQAILLPMLSCLI